jgi:hypothetical protein
MMEIPLFVALWWQSTPGVPLVPMYRRSVIQPLSHPGVAVFIHEVASISCIPLSSALCPAGGVAKAVADKVVPMNTK